MAEADIKVSEQLQEIFRRLESEVNEIAGQRMAISLCIFNSVPGARISYVSNCKREDVMTAWSSIIKVWEQGMTDVPAHKYNS